MSSTPLDLPLPAAEAYAPSAQARVRLAAIDRIRGLVMVLMTLDHVRHYFTNIHFNPLDPELTNGPLYLTRWITHLCAPTFVFLAGVSAFLVSQRLTPAELSRFLFTRGLWLVVVEVVVINLAWSFNPAYSHGIFLQVIWAIGISMMVLAVLVRLPRMTVLCLSVVLIAGHNALDGIEPEVFGSWATVWKLLHVSGPLPFGFVAYPVLPWIGIMAFGYCAGSLYQQESGYRQLVLFVGGCGALTAFFVLRLINGYGDPQPWVSQATFAQTLFAFFDVEKYPPSLMYVLATLGCACLLLAAAERSGNGPLARALNTFGRVPFFFYILHIVLAHAAAGALALFMGHGTDMLVIRSMFDLPQGWGFDLPVVYLAWIAVVLAAYPLCRWFADLKRRRQDWWLSYL